MSHLNPGTIAGRLFRATGRIVGHPSVFGPRPTLSLNVKPPLTITRPRIETIIPSHPVGPHGHARGSTQVLATSKPPLRLTTTARALTTVDIAASPPVIDLLPPLPVLRRPVVTERTADTETDREIAAEALIEGTMVTEALLSADRAVNVLFGGQDETISARIGRAEQRGSIGARILGAPLNLVDPGHTQKALASSTIGRNCIPITASLVQQMCTPMLVKRICR